jgi:hypothetical protein
MPNMEIESFRVRITFIGEQMSGKTTVVKLLSNLPHMPQQDRTDSLEISCVSVHENGWQELEEKDDKEEALVDGLMSFSFDSNQPSNLSNVSHSKSFQDMPKLLKQRDRIVLSANDFIHMNSAMSKCSHQTQKEKKKKIYFWGTSISLKKFKNNIISFNNRFCRSTSVLCITSSFVSFIFFVLFF